MKTKAFARGILKIRVILLCMAVIGMAGTGLSLGRSLAVRLGQPTAPHIGDTQAPNANLADVMAAARY